MRTGLRSIQKFAVDNRAQYNMYVGEMQGQISDGHWENRNPHDHWVPWCNIDEIVIDPDNPGIETGIPPYVRNYKMDNLELLEAIGGRLMFKYVLGKEFPNVVLNESEFHAFDDFVPCELPKGVKNLRQQMQMYLAYSLPELQKKYSGDPEQYRLSQDYTGSEEFLSMSSRDQFAMRRAGEYVRLNDKCMDAYQVDFFTVLESLAKYILDHCNGIKGAFKEELRALSNNMKKDRAV